MKKAFILPAAFLLFLPALSFAAEEAAHHGASIPVWSVIPFILMLAAIAFIPLKFEHWWENNNNKLIVSLILGIPTAIYIFIESPSSLLHTMLEYVQFIILLFALFVVSGGIVFRSNLRPLPIVNTGILALGSILASFMGTTGASMVLIRPMIRINESRVTKNFMIIFFIFLVSNIGGCLTPLGDPPLFMGYLRGVPFTWTFNLFPEWLIAVAIVLAVYYVWDTLHVKKETLPPPRPLAPGEKAFGTAGNINFLWLGGIVICVAFITEPLFLREAIMLILVALSLKTTPKPLRAENKFTYNPIIEVAYLFFGIFLTMIPALIILETRGGELGVTKPWQFFWMAGSLSSFLDNTPTYLVFFELAKSLNMTENLVAATGISFNILAAISLGAVFMGANTYIGNAPNFMVKVIAEESKIKMPSFLGYMVWSISILIPIFLLFTFFHFIHLQ